MFSLILEGALIVMLIGAAIKIFLDKTDHEAKINNEEFWIASAVLLVVVIPLTAYIGTKASISNQVTYNENWGGYELSADWQHITCSEDGPCVHTYDCDPYQVWVDDSYTDDKGNYHSQGHYETRYHDCPYTDEEWTFTINTTLGRYTIASHNLPTNPDQHRWDRTERVPARYESGIPEFWQAADNRLKHGIHGPVTARRQYDNYILASQHTILQRYSSDVDRYKKAGLLPDLNQQAIYDFYYSNRVFFVGTQPSGDWQGAINRFDAALGASRQGDLYLVIVNANTILDPDNYSGALTAYWQSKAYGKDALSKNGIIVVLGTRDGQTVSWARATTGMPEGNEDMVLDVQNMLKGAPLNPQSILGNPNGQFNGNELMVQHTQGALENILWGAHPFTRVHMKAHGQGAVGYAYLLREIQPTTGQRIFILVLMAIFGVIGWIVCIVHGAQGYRYHRYGY